MSYSEEAAEAAASANAAARRAAVQAGLTGSDGPAYPSNSDCYNEALRIILNLHRILSTIPKSESAQKVRSNALRQTRDMCECLASRLANTAEKLETGIYES